MAKTTGGTPHDDDGHDDDLPYQEVGVPAENIDLQAWTVRLETDRSGVTTYYVAGPCPACRAADQRGRHVDVPAPIEAQGGRDRISDAYALADTVEVAVVCRCGRSHGTQGSDGCGRFWSLLCQRAGR